MVCHRRTMRKGGWFVMIYFKKPDFPICFLLTSFLSLEEERKINLLSDTYDVLLYCVLMQQYE